MFGAIAGIASSVLGGLGGGGGGGLLGKIGGLLSGGLGNVLSKLLGGGGGEKGPDVKDALGDIKNLLERVLDKLDKDGGAEGPSHSCGEGGKKPGADEGEGGGKSDCCSKPEPKPEPEPENGCGCEGSEGTDDADKADGPKWDGVDKSPSLDRERSAIRLLEQAKETDDPKEKRELIKMALEMLGDGEGCDCTDGNSYDQDMVEKAEEMLEKIDGSCLSECGKGKAMDGVIDMLTEEGGVDGEPAADGCGDEGDGGSCDGGDDWMNTLPHPAHDFHLHHRSDR